MGKDVSETRQRPERQPSRTARQQWIACIVSLAIVTGIGWMLYATQGWMNKGYGLAFFTAIALVTGLLFWTLTPSPFGGDSVHWKDLGFRLGGGAAIGLVFAYVGWQMVPPDSEYVVASLPLDVGETALRARAGEGVKWVEVLVSSRRLVVELEPRRKSGTVVLRWLDERSEIPIVTRAIIVDRSGVETDEMPAK